MYNQKTYLFFRLNSPTDFFTAEMSQKKKQVTLHNTHAINKYIYDSMW